MVRTIALASAALVLLPGCTIRHHFGGGEAGASADQAVPAEDAGDAETACGAEAHQDLVGQARAEIDAASLPDLHRIYGPDDAVTMDYRPDRLNVRLDADGMVAEVACG